MDRFQFVADHQHAYMVKRLCAAVQVARSSFYAWVEAAPARAERAAADAELAERIRTVQDPKQGGDRAYGAPRVTADLNDGVPVAGRVNHKRVYRIYLLSTVQNWVFRNLGGRKSMKLFS